MANIGRMIAAAGALAGGYMQGKKMQEDADWEKERRQQERDAMQREADVRQAAASTLGQAGTTSGAVVSGEDAMAAGEQAQADALARATTDQERAAVQEQFAPTMAALVSQRGTAATAGTPYTPEQAQGDFVKKMYAIDPNKAMDSEVKQNQLAEQRREAALKAEIPEFMKSTKAYEARVTGRAAGISDTLADSAAYLALQAKHGKYDPNAWLSIAEKTQKIEDEGFVKALRKADGGAPTLEVIKEFNKSGKQQIDPANVASDTIGEVVLRGQKVPSRIITVKDAAGNERTINVAAELAGLGETKELLALHFAGKKDRRDDKHLVIDGGKAASAANASAATVALHGVQAKSAQMKLDQEKLANSAKVKMQKGEALTPEERAVVAVAVSPEAENKVLDDVRATAASNMKGGAFASMDADMTKKLDRVTSEAANILAENRKSGKKMNSAELYTEATRRASAPPAKAGWGVKELK